MRAYRKSLIDELEYRADGAALPVELLLRPIKMKKRLKVVNIDYRERIGQTTMRSAGNLVVDAEAHSDGAVLMKIYKQEVA